MAGDKKDASEPPRRYRRGCRTLPYLRHEFVYERSRFWSQPQRLYLLRANKAKMFEFRHPQSFEAGNFAETQAFKDRRIRSLSMMLTSVVPPRSFRRTIHRLGRACYPLSKISYAHFSRTRCVVAKPATGSTDLVHVHVDRKSRELKKVENSRAHAGPSRDATARASWRVSIETKYIGRGY